MLKIILTAAALTLALPLTATASATTPAHAQETTSDAVAVSPALTRRADDVVKFLNGEGDARQLFAQSFLDQAPPERLARMVAAVRQRYGPALSVSRIEPNSPTEAVMHLVFGETEMPVLLQVTNDADARIEGLLFQGMGRGGSNRR